MRAAGLAVVLALTATALAAAGCKGDRKQAASSREVAPDEDEIRIAGPPAPASAPVAGAPVAAGPMRKDHVLGDYAVVVPPGGDVDGARAAIEAEARRLGLAVQTAPLGIDEELADRTLQVVTAPAADVVILELVDAKGRGLGPDDATAIATADAIAFAFRAPAAEVAEVHRAAAALARAGATAARGWIHDPFTHETLSRDAFEAARGDLTHLDVRDLVSIHVVRDGEALVFLETVGLRRFGLPELLIRRVPHTFAHEVHQLVNAAAQTLVERGALPRDGELDVDLARLATPAWREAAAAIADAGGAGRLTLRARWSLPVDPEPDAAPVLVELDLPPAPGARAERLHAAAIAFLGDTPPEVIGAADDDRELAAARTAALAELAALAPRFARGIPDLEHLIVKAPFATDDGGVEWMWVEVHAWRGATMKGVLLNQPLAIAALRPGATVEVEVAELFDYVHKRADGTTAGGRTQEILERRQGGR